MNPILCKINGNFNAICNKSITLTTSQTRYKMRYQIPLRCSKLLNCLVKRRNKIYKKINFIINNNCHIRFIGNYLMINNHYDQYNHYMIYPHMYTYDIKKFHNRVNKFCAFQYVLHYDDRHNFYFILVTKITFSKKCIYCNNNKSFHSDVFLYGGCNNFKSNSYVDQYFIGAIFVKNMTNEKYKKYAIYIFDHFVKIINQTKELQNIISKISNTNRCLDLQKYIGQINYINILAYKIFHDKYLCYDLRKYIGQFNYNYNYYIDDSFLVNLKEFICDKYNIKNMKSI